MTGMTRDDYSRHNKGRLGRLGMTKDNLDNWDDSESLGMTKGD